MSEFIHLGLPKGYVPAVEVKNGLQLLVDKHYFIQHFIGMKSIEVQNLILEFDIVIVGASGDDLLIRFDSK